MDEIYAALKEKYPELAVNHSAVESIYSTDESITYAGKRKVLGGNGSGTPDGLAWVTIGTVNYFTEDIATIVSPDASLDERLLAAAFTFVKPLKLVDDGIDVGVRTVKGLKAKGTDNAAHNTAQYQKLKEQLALDEIQSVVNTTKHGAERLIERGFTPRDLSDLKLRPDIIKTQSDGAQVFIKQVNGKYNVIVEGDNGVITSLKNISENSLNRLSDNYDWR